MGTISQDLPNLEELQQKLRSTIMVRRLKSEVLKELPKKRRQVIELGAEGARIIVKREQEAYNRWQDTVANGQIEQLFALSDNDEQSYRDAVARFEYESDTAFDEMSRVRKEVAMAKIPFVISHLESALECGKVVCFAHHHAVINEIHKAFPNSVVVTGDTKLNDRQKAVDSFQTDPSVNLFIGNIIAAGVGLTLTASSHVVFVELDWRPGFVTQCEDRCHRIGQLNSVLVQHLLLEGSTDVNMARTIIHKQEIIDKALDQPTAVEEIVLEDKRIEELRPALELSEISSSLSAYSNPVARKSILEELSFEDLKAEYESYNVSAEVAEAVQKALRILSSYCDGAIALDGSGFNKIDVGVGNRLASAKYLTGKQVMLGRKIIMKYHRQLPAEINELIRKCEPLKEQKQVGENTKMDIRSIAHEPASGLSF